MKEKYVNVQILGEETHKCAFCGKETKHKVAYFPANKMTWLLVGAIGLALLGNAHVGLVCENCNTHYLPDQKEYKQKYGWSNFYGFRKAKSEYIKIARYGRELNGYQPPKEHDSNKDEPKENMIPPEEYISSDKSTTKGKSNKTSFSDKLITPNKTRNWMLIVVIILGGILSGIVAYFLDAFVIKKHIKSIWSRFAIMLVIAISLVIFVEIPIISYIVNPSGFTQPSGSFLLYNSTSAILPPANSSDVKFFYNSFTLYKKSNLTLNYSSNSTMIFAIIPTSNLIVLESPLASSNGLDVIYNYTAQNGDIQKQLMPGNYSYIFLNLDNYTAYVNMSNVYLVS